MAFATSGSKPLVALSMFGITTPGVLRMRDWLKPPALRRWCSTQPAPAASPWEDRSGRDDRWPVDATWLNPAMSCSAASSVLDRPASPQQEMGIPQVVIPGAAEV